MGDRLRDILIEKVERLRKMRELRDTIEQMRCEVKSEVGKLSGLRFTSYKDAMGWLAAHNAMRTEKQAS